MKRPLLLIIVFLIFAGSALADTIFYQGNSTTILYATPLYLGYNLTSANATDGLIWVNLSVAGGSGCGGGTSCPIFQIDSNNDATYYQGWTLKREDSRLKYYISTTVYDFPNYVGAPTWGSNTYANVTLALSTDNNNGSAWVMVNGGSLYYMGNFTVADAATKSIGTIWIGNGDAPSNLTNVVIYAKEILPVSNFTITVKDPKGTSLTNFSASIDGTEYSTSTGTITTNLYNNATSLYDIFIYGANNTQGPFFNRTYANTNLSSNLQASLYQVEFSFDAEELATSNPVLGAFKINGSTANATNKLLAGVYNLSVTNASYYQKDLIQNITPLFNGTITITGVYNSLVNISVRNAYTLQNLTNFTGWAYHNATGYNQSFLSSTGTLPLGLLKGVWYIYAEAPNYSIGEDNYQGKNITNTTDSFIFSLYSQNSIRIYVYDEATGFQITGTNITIIVTGNSSEDTYTTLSGFYYLENLTDGNYTLKFTGGNYTLKSYQVTVADYSTQQLNAYLSTNTETVTFEILDYDTASPVEGASMTMSRLINSTWTVVDAKTSDLTGRVQLTYLPNVAYRFAVSNDDYTTKIFDLDPVLFSEYTVRLQKETTLQNDTDYLGVFVYYAPTLFYSNQSNSFTWEIYSGVGALESYEYNLSYPGGVLTGLGTNAIGESFTSNFTMTDAEAGDLVNLSYCYKSSIGTIDRCFSVSYSIIGIYGDLSWLANKDNTFGLELWVRLVVATLVVVITAGLFAFYIDPLVGLIVGMIVWALMVAQGFIPLWGILPSMLVAFIILAARGAR